MQKTFCDQCGVELLGEVYRAALGTEAFDLCRTCAQPLQDLVTRREADRCTCDLPSGSFGGVSPKDRFHDRDCPYWLTGR